MLASLLYSTPVFCSTCWAFAIGSWLNSKPSSSALYIQSEARQGVRPSGHTPVRSRTWGQIGRVL